MYTPEEILASRGFVPFICGVRFALTGTNNYARRRETINAIATFHIYAVEINFGQMDIPFLFSRVIAVFSKV